MNNCVILMSVVLVCGMLTSAFTKKSEGFGSACFLCLAIGIGYLIYKGH